MADKEVKPSTSGQTQPQPTPETLTGAKPPPSTKLQKAVSGGNAPSQKNDMPTYIEEENKQKSDNLTQAKDRAQLTATTAMSIIHIDLLKDLLVTGPDKVRFYTASLTLISLCLALQVLAGIISLTVGYMRNYYTKYKGDACADLISNICCCTLRCNGSDDNKDKDSNDDDGIIQDDTTDKKDTSSQGDDTDVSAKQTLLYLKPVAPRREEQRKPKTDTRGCCPCYLTTDLYADVESDTLSRYDNWIEKQLDVELEAAEAKVHVTRLKEIIHNAKLKLNKLKASNSGNLEQQTNEINDMLDEAENLQQTYQGFVWTQEIARIRGEILWKQSHQIRENHMLKMTSFWQQVLNYIFYALFVLNAFIMGLGIAGAHQSQVTNQIAASPGSFNSGNSSQN